MRRNPYLGMGLLVGLAIGFLVSFSPIADASRNSGGTMSLASGNPVVSGTAITSTWANNTLSDVASEITNSLDRQGRGAMLAPLQCTSGSVSAPSLTFSSETNSGLYRFGSADVRMSIAGSSKQRWIGTGVEVLGDAGVTNTLNAANGISTQGSVIASGDGGFVGSVAAAGFYSSNGYTGSATIPAAATVFATKYLYDSTAMSTTNGADYPLSSVRTSSSPNTVGLTVRAKNTAGGGGWGNVALGLSYDVDATEGSGGQLWFEDGTVKIGSTSSDGITSIYTTSATINPTDLLEGECSTSTVNKTGVTTNSHCIMTARNAPEDPVFFDCRVSAADTITARICAQTNALNPASNTYDFLIIK